MPGGHTHGEDEGEMGKGEKVAAVREGKKKGGNKGEYEGENGLEGEREGRREKGRQ